MSSPIKNEDLVFHFLNVGFGDCILIEFPADKNGIRTYGAVDCLDSGKMKKYIDSLQDLRPGDKKLRFICATHPHQDHVKGISNLLTDPRYAPLEFWDSGFRHKSLTYMKILEDVVATGLKMVRVSSGMEWYFGRVQVTALSPSIRLRNRYSTYGVDINNASIVLRFEHHKDDYVLQQSLEYKGESSVLEERNASQAVVILAGDAEYDSWSHITEEYPRLETMDANRPLVKKMLNMLNCSVVKVAHHGSMHSSPLDVYEKMGPKYAIISTKQQIDSKKLDDFTIERGLFPHPSAESALEEVNAHILTTDGCYEGKR